jgi:hypothetical protein
MHLIQPAAGVGPLLLGMSPEEAAALLGPADRTRALDEAPYLSKERRASRRGQVAESRDKHRLFKIVDLVFLKRKLVSITVDGKDKTVVLLDLPVSSGRMALLQRVREAFPDDVRRNSESYAFPAAGLIISRSGTQKHINYVDVCDPAFLQTRLAIDFFEPYHGPLEP